jgi:hypothetical protein
VGRHGRRRDAAAVIFLTANRRGEPLWAPLRILHTGIYSDLISKTTLYIVYALMGVCGLFSAYALLTYGSPQSLLRHIFPDPLSDWYVAVGGSVLFFILGAVPYLAKQDSAFRDVVEANAQNIRHHRDLGRSDEEIAITILDAAKIKPGYRYNIARKKLMYYLSQFK